ncbi:hypothetical protein H4R34_004891 [Dimargaris verticillata]|uniref:Aminotransferase class I/classII large domain-containing protein n=1 Tax=Dimargaris verticillata TaxID=2761393 RepID=A0A9W8AY12_9FUNG|nr:hypothetical protein H4R34_004891 [Dimargaris verticillata]
MTGTNASTTAPLSKRLMDNTAFVSPLLDGIIAYAQNAFDREKNPKGIVNLGMSENRLLHDRLEPFVQSKLQVHRRHFSYGMDPLGPRELRQALASMINQHFNPFIQIQPEHLSVHNGTTSVIDIFAFSACDAGDGILVATPSYGGFELDTQVRAKALLIPVRTTMEQMLDADQHVAQMVKAYDQAVADGITVRAMILCNPHNPLGVCYPRAMLERLLQFAGERNLHVLSDESFALSCYNDALKAMDGAAAEVLAHEAASPYSAWVDQTFTSVLAIDTLRDLIDPSLVHIVHGASKDFGMNGMRIGYLISPWNPTLLQALLTIALFTWNSQLMEDLMTQIFADSKWINTYVAASHVALAKAYTRMAQFLIKYKIPYMPARASHSIWMDLRQFCHRPEGHNSTECTLAMEKDLWQRMIQGGVFAVMGQAFQSQEHGWFRLSFTLAPEDLELALARLETTLQLKA